jgi:hypothetical protein
MMTERQVVELVARKRIALDEVSKVALNNGASPDCQRIQMQIELLEEILEVPHAGRTKKARNP